MRAGMIRFVGGLVGKMSAFATHGGEKSHFSASFVVKTKA